jgi:hypothetical protein
MNENVRRTRGYTVNDGGAIIVEAAIVAVFLLTLVLSGLYLARYVNTHAILITAARDTGRVLSRFDPSGSGLFPPGHVFSDDDYVALVSVGIAVARRSVQTAGLNPDHFGYRISSLRGTTSAGAGQIDLQQPFEEIEVAVFNEVRGPFEPQICAKARFKYELFHEVNHYLGSEPDPC